MLILINIGDEFPCELSFLSENGLSDLRAALLLVVHISRCCLTLGVIQYILCKYTNRSEELALNEGLREEYNTLFTEFMKMCTNSLVCISLHKKPLIFQKFAEHTLRKTYIMY